MRIRIPARPRKPRLGSQYASSRPRPALADQESVLLVFELLAGVPEARSLAHGPPGLALVLLVLSTRIFDAKCYTSHQLTPTTPCRPTRDRGSVPTGVHHGITSDAHTDKALPE